jgi:hypothetical protein
MLQPKRLSGPSICLVTATKVCYPFAMVSNHKRSGLVNMKSRLEFESLAADFTKPTKEELLCWLDLCFYGQNAFAYTLHSIGTIAHATEDSGDFALVYTLWRLFLDLGIQLEAGRKLLANTLSFYIWLLYLIIRSTTKMSPKIQFSIPARGVRGTLKCKAGLFGRDSEFTDPLAIFLVRFRPSSSYTETNIAVSDCGR